MSTYYIIRCCEHGESSDAASRTAGGYCHYGYGDQTLIPFLIAHAGCSLVVESEHDWPEYMDEEGCNQPDSYDGPMYEGQWSPRDLKTLIESAQARGNWK